MAATVTPTDRAPINHGQIKQRRGTFTFDTSYPTGGLATTPTALGVSTLVDLQVHDANGYTVQWDGSTSAPKIKAYSAAGTEVTNATNLSTVTVRYLAWGY